jgi:glycosyltransferase involved in cell wall biosynthesis
MPPAFFFCRRVGARQGDRMRVALLHYTLPPVIGGVERLVGDQARALAALGHEVALFSRHDREGFRVWLAESAAGAVLVHNVFTMPFDLEWTRELTAQAASQPRWRWINWVHDVAAVNPQYAALGWKEAVPAACHVAVSEARRRDYLRATGLPAVSVRVIPNGIDLAAVLGLPPRLAALPLWDHELVLAHPARLIRRKNIEFGLRVTAALRRAGLDAAYAVTGAPDPHQADGVRYLAELRALREAEGLGQAAVFLGEQAPLDEAEVRGLYQRADALFFPSTGEGFGLPLLEAAAHRLPVWCSDLPVHREVLGASAQFFDPAADPDAVSARIVQWWRDDPAGRARKLLLRDHALAKICLEHLEPLLLATHS